MSVLHLLDNILKLLGIGFQSVDLSLSCEKLEEPIYIIVEACLLSASWFEHESEMLQFRF